MWLKFLCGDLSDQERCSPIGVLSPLLITQCWGKWGEMRPLQTRFPNEWVLLILVFSSIYPQDWVLTLCTSEYALSLWQLSLPVNICWVFPIFLKLIKQRDKFYFTLCMHAHIPGHEDWKLTLAHMVQRKQFLFVLNLIRFGSTPCNAQCLLLTLKSGISPGSAEGPNEIPGSESR